MATVLVSAFFALLVVRTRGTYFVMITLAEGMVVWGIALRWQELTGGENGIPGVPKPDFADAYWQYYYLVLIVVAVCTVLIGLLVRSPFGLALKGIRDAEDRLAPLGYNATLHKLIAFTISGFFAGIAGLLLAMYNSFIGPSDVFFLASAEGLLMSILGGIGTISGAFVGAAGVVVIITNWVSSYVDRWQTLLGVVFVLVIIFAPDGIVGAWTRWVWEPLQRRLGRRASGPGRPGRSPRDEGGKSVKGRRPRRLRARPWRARRVQRARPGHARRRPGADHGRPADAHERDRRRRRHGHEERLGPVVPAERRRRSRAARSRPSTRTRRATRRPR